MGQMLLLRPGNSTGIMRGPSALCLSRLGAHLIRPGIKSQTAAFTWIVSWSTYRPPPPALNTEVLTIHPDWFFSKVGFFLSLCLQGVHAPHPPPLEKKKITIPRARVLFLCSASFNPALSVQSWVQRVWFPCDSKYMQICQQCPLSRLSTHADNMLPLVASGHSPPMWLEVFGLLCQSSNAQIRTWSMSSI